MTGKKKSKVNHCVERPPKINLGTIRPCVLTSASPYHRDHKKWLKENYETNKASAREDAQRIKMGAKKK